MAALLILVPGFRSAAQTPDVGRSTISGEVIDAGTGAPIAGARVALLRASAARGSAAIAISPLLAIAGSAITGPAGAYRFTDLPFADYQLRVTRIGYHAVTVDVVVRGDAATLVSVGLQVVPIRLQALEVRRQATPSYGRHEAEADDGGMSRIEAARTRQEQYLSADVREVTHSDVLESVSLGETDVFRAFQRLPGVVSRDEYSAELWIRGARWDHTRIYFDGLPLFSPLHAFGGISGVGADAVGSALLHPGVRPVELGEGSAAVIDLRSRTGTGTGAVQGVGELSLLSARLAVDQRSADGKTAWMVAARRSYLDWLVGGLGRMQHDETMVMPYHFAGVVGRLDRKLSDTRALEVSGILERDYVTGDIPDVRHGNNADWGNRGIQMSLVEARAAGSARHTAGIVLFSADIREVTPNEVIDGTFNAAAQPELNSALMQARVGSAFEKRTPLGTTSYGYDLVGQRASFVGSSAYVITGDSDRVQMRRARTLPYASLWVNRRQPLATRVELQAGLRVDGGAAFSNHGMLRPAPRLMLRFSPDAATHLSVAAGRSFQYAQTTWRGDDVLSPQILPIRVWVLASRDDPALTTDLLTAAAERWLTPTILFTTAAYLRHSTGMTMPDPTPGILIGRPLYVVGSELARGVEIGARRVAGRLTGSISYSRGAASLSAARLSFRSPNMRPRSLDASARLRIASWWHFGAAYTDAAGVPYTRISEGGLNEDESGRLHWQEPPWAGPPSGQQGSGYQSLDLQTDWTFGLFGARLSIFAQVQNALGRSHASSLYVGYEDCPPNNQFCTSHDEFVPGMPRIPVLGFRLAF